MERLIQQAILGLTEYAKVTVVGPSGCGEHLPDNVVTVEVPASLTGFLTQSLLKARKLAGEQQFDLILGGSGLAALSVTHAARHSGATTAVFLHGLDLVVNNWLYQRLLLPRLKNVDLLIANSRNTLALANAKGVTCASSVVIHPGATLPSAKDSPTYQEFCQKQGIHYDQYLLFVGRLTERKGLSRFLRESFTSIAAQMPKVGLVVVGHAPHQSLNQRGEEAEVLETSRQLGLENRITFLGKLSDDDLWSAYRLATAHVFPLCEVPGDVEGFGMVAVEAAACGTPTVAFDAGGVADAVSEKSGYLIPADDYPRFTSTLQQLLIQKEPSAQMCREHASLFAWPRYHSQLRTNIEAIVRVEKQHQ